MFISKERYKALLTKVREAEVSLALLARKVKEMRAVDCEVRCKRLSETAVLPTKAHPEDAGYDLYADCECDIPPHKTVKVGTGVAMALPANTFGAIYARSGLATKHGLRPANCVGVCDSSYRGEYIVAIYNDSDETQHINRGDRIAQLIIQNFVPAVLAEVSELDTTERGEGGFGSSGKN